MSGNRWLIRRRPTVAFHGFTLVEVLVVVGVIALLVLFVLPTVTDRRPPGRTFCQSNTKQLAIAWLMYATDYNDRLVRNQAYAGMPIAPTNNWVYGMMDWSANPDNTNANVFVDPAKSLFGGYNKNPAAYHCPADDSVSAAGPRVRSYSMNGFMGDTGRGPALSGWRQYLKTSDLKAPAQKFVIGDEHPNSIDDGYFLNDPAGTNTWLDLPTSRHDGAAVFAFADGHAELHRWVDTSTRQPVVPKAPKASVPIPPRQFQDFTWLQQRATEPWTNH